MNKHPWSSPEVIANLSKEPIGECLAAQVEEMLYCDRFLLNQKSDYSGYGLDHDGTSYRLFTSVDGEIDKVVATWETHNEFVEFFAKQSDYSMSGADEKEPLFYTEDSFLLNNQTLTKTTLETVSNFAYRPEKMALFNFFIRHFPNDKQEEFKQAYFNIEVSFDRAIAVTLSKTNPKIIYEFETNYQGPSKGEAVTEGLNALSRGVGIEEVFTWEGAGTQYTIVRAYNDFLVTLGYRFVYWVEDGLYDFVGFVVKEDELAEVMAFAKANKRVFQPILETSVLPDWFKIQEGQVDLKQVLVTEALAAKALGRDLFLYLGMEGCRPCEVVENSIAQPDMSAAFENTYIVKIDVMSNLSELYKNFMKVLSAPVFVYVTPEGQISNLKITGDAWGEEDTIENISHALTPFFKKASQAVPLTQSLSQKQVADVIGSVVSSSDLEHLKWMLEVSEYDFSAGGATFLHQASSLNSPIEFIDYALNKGADVDAKSPSGNTALHNSILSERADITAKLLESGADINAQTNDGKSILFLVIDDFWFYDRAHEEGSPEYEGKLLALINYCISLGVDLTLKDVNGDTALSYTKLRKPKEPYQLEVLKVLEG